jgi:hypothetical protein
VPQASSQEFIRATVHLAGEVDYETGHSTRVTAEHVQTRIGSALVYLLDFIAAGDFARAARLGAERAQGLFPAGHTASLPEALLHSGQESSVIVRMRGAQTSATAQAISAAANRHRRPYLTCQIGGLVLVLHDAEAVARLVEVAETSYRVAAALWPITAALMPDSGKDEYAERWEQQQQASR